jgi:hypothetical protein
MKNIMIFQDYLKKSSKNRIERFLGYNTRKSRSSSIKMKKKNKEIKVKGIKMKNGNLTLMNKILDKSLKKRKKTR